MPSFHRHLSATKISVWLLLPLMLAAVLSAFAQENTSADSSLPLVYGVENTGAGYAAPVFPSFEQLPIIRPLPDPFVFFSDGTRDTSFSRWEQRRNEIIAALEKYEIGPKPDCHDCTIAATWAPPTGTQKSGKLTITITRTPPSTGLPATMTLTSYCYVPPGTTSPIPVILTMGTSSGNANSGLGTGSLPAAAFAGLTVGSCPFAASTVARYGGPTRNDGFFQLYPEYCAGTTYCTAANGFPNGSNSGEYAEWSWGVSRLIDGIALATQQSPALPFDLSHILVTGCSYAGKMALYAGALDERVALTIAQENGGGGQPSWRASQQIEADDVVENLTHTDHNWFSSQMWQFQGNNVYKEPIDHHELAALIAPRALLETGNTNYLWLSNRSNYISARATQRIYNTLGIGDRYGFFIDGNHMHCGTNSYEVPVIAAWAKKFLFGDTAQDTDTEVFPVPSFYTKAPYYDYTLLDYGRWTAWWGTNNPVFPNNWNPGDGTVVMSMNRPLAIGFNDDVVAGYDLWMDGSHPAATVSLAGADVQTDISCPDGSSYTLTIPLPAQSYSIAAGDNSWYPSPNQKSPSVYQGSAKATSCNGTGAGAARSAYFSALGVQATHGAGNAAGPGFPNTDTTDPLNVRFHCDLSGSKGPGGSWSPTVTVNYQPQ